MKARDNPYAVSRVLRVRYRWTEGECHGLMARLRACGNRGAIVGPHGSGKTTLLEDLQPRIEAEGFRVFWVRLCRDEPEVPGRTWRYLQGGLEPDEFVFLDGAEQMSWWTWRKFQSRCRRGAGLLITRHEPGGLPVIWTCRTSARLLGDIVRRLDPRRRTDSERWTEALWRRHEGNVREALRELYDREAGLVRGLRSEV